MQCHCGLLVPVASLPPLIDKLLLAMLWEATVFATINPKGKTSLVANHIESRNHVFMCCKRNAMIFMKVFNNL